MRLSGLAPACLAMFSVCLLNCAARRVGLNPSSMAFLVRIRGSVPYLIGPAAQGQDANAGVPFSEVLLRTYHLNFHESSLDLTPGMRLQIQQPGPETQTDISYYEVQRRRGGRSALVETGGLRGKAAVAGPTIGTRTSARHLRFFYAVKFVEAAGQPYRPAFLISADSETQLAARAAQAHKDSDRPCTPAALGCLSFSKRAIVSPEIPIAVNGNLTYVLLGSSIREILQASGMRSVPVGLHILRRYKSHMIEVIWEQPLDVMNLPLIAGDQISW